ncbi:hypothetical protein MSAN_00624200 [Mycena sanguinolenta]|uniref:Uncharacterized protein n=1 Tax=Mycena sanguinolenta TaxID=230812 RepID=A0A8H6Z414_9AGAR|nr:hypothetical protein MSAN_00624200 [Mycena sanguinolenta]
MILILLAVHLLSKDGKAALLSHSLDARATPDSCDNINSCRTLFSVVWGCLATIFACTWVSVHPNVPPARPEPSSAFLAKAENDAHRNDRPGSHGGICSQTISWVSLVEFNFSPTHGMFFCMGGFVSSDEHPIATKEQLEDPNFGLELQKAIQNVKEKDITDKSKGDALSKGVALLQGLWFILQTLARAHQHLAITQLEVATLAFAIVNIFIWLLWWNKPLDVQRPIVVGSLTQPATETVTLSVQLSLRDRFIGAIGVNYGDRYKPVSSVSVPSFWSIENNETNVSDTGADPLLLLVGTLLGAIHCTAWNAIFPTPAEMWIWRTSSLAIAALPSLTFFFFPLTLTGSDCLEATVNVIMTLAIPIYIAARLILIGLPFAELRSLPASAFMDVNWSTYIPHL